MNKILNSIRMFVLCNRRVFVCEVNFLGVRVLLEILSGSDNAEGELAVKLLKIGDGYFCPITINVWLISFGIFIEKKEKDE